MELMDIRDVFDDLTDRMFAISTDMYDGAESFERQDGFDLDEISSHEEDIRNLVGRCLEGKCALPVAPDMELGEAGGATLSAWLFLARKEAVAEAGRLSDSGQTDRRNLLDVCRQVLTHFSVHRPTPSTSR